MAGFALASPLIALLLAALLALAGSLWQREVGAALLSQAVGSAASHGGSLSAAEEELEREAAAAGLVLGEVRWRVDQFPGVSLISATTSLELGGGVLPEFTASLRSRSLIG